MSPDFKSKYITLDWDNISIDEANKRMQYILDNYANVKQFVLSLSPTKGFHCRITLYSASNVARLRKEWKDDGRRLVNDLLNRPDRIHDILWSRKTLYGITWEEKELTTYVRS